MMWQWDSYKNILKVPTKNNDSTCKFVDLHAMLQNILLLMIIDKYEIRQKLHSHLWSEHYLAPDQSLSLRALVGLWPPHQSLTSDSRDSNSCCVTLEALCTCRNFSGASYQSISRYGFCQHKELFCQLPTNNAWTEGQQWLGLIGQLLTDNPVGFCCWRKGPVISYQVFTNSNSTSNLG